LDRFKQTRFARNAGSSGSSDRRAALSVAQYGGKHPDAKPWKGLGPGVFEVVSDYKTDTFRAGYVVRFEPAHGEDGC
jgi:phage-related protein